MLAAAVAAANAVTITTVRKLRVTILPTTINYSESFSGVGASWRMGYMRNAPNPNVVSTMPKKGKLHVQWNVIALWR